MKRILAILCALAMAALLFAGCGGTDTPTEPPTTSFENQPAELQLIVPGTLTVGTEIGYPPFEQFADDGTTPIGLDIELATKLAEMLGVAVAFQNTDFEGILDGLGTDKYDVVMSAVTITAARKEKVDFSSDYIENWQSIVVRKGAEPVDSPEGMNGKTVALQKATTSTEFLDKLTSTGAITCTDRPYEKVMDCFNDLKLGRADLVLCDSVVAEAYVEREPDEFEISWHESTVEGAEPELFGIGVKKGNADLLDAINAALAELEASGWMDDLRQRWLA